MGLYFLTPAAGVRPYDVLYDRAGAAFATADPGAWDWDQALDGAAWLHLSGVTPALGPGGAQAAMNVVAAARARSVRIAFDGNYRARLWSQWDGDAPSILSGLLAGVDLAFVNERDLELALKQDFSDLAPSERLPAAASAAFQAFPQLTRIATTQRLESRALVGVLIDRQGRAVQSRPYSLDGAVDRIGAGDAFAAGLLDGLLRDQPAAAAIEFATAAACLKHGLHGDFNLASREDIESLVNGETADVRR
jgi:2-dehydro-3-deoxygluconokinase